MPTPKRRKRAKSDIEKGIEAVQKIAAGAVILRQILRPHLAKLRQGKKKKK